MPRLIDPRNRTAQRKESVHSAPVTFGIINHTCDAGADSESIENDE